MARAEVIERSGEPTHCIRWRRVAGSQCAAREQVNMRRKSLLSPIAAAVIALLLCAHPARSNPCTLAALQWMAGTWRAHTADTESEERWVKSPGGRLMGSSWLLHTDTPGGVIEAMALVVDDGRAVMRLRHFDSTLAHAREDKDAPMLFVAATCTANSVTLDGTGDQAGEHFTYTREGNRMKFVGEFIHGGKPIRVELEFTGDVQP
jgi:hypothetical protein